MDRRQFILKSSLLSAGAFIPFKNIMAAAPGTFTPLRRNVGYFTERGGTIGWLAAKDGLMMVDAGYPDQARHCLAGLQQKTSHPMDLLINTHHHGDHTGGNPIIIPVAKKAVAHENVPILMKKVAEESKSDVPPAYPTTTFSDSWNTEVSDEKIYAQYYGPAHTGGDAVIYFEKANVVHVGDIVFNRINPYTDRPHGASIHHWIKVLDKIIATYPDDAIFIFGHGKPEFGVTGKKEDLKVMKNYFSAMVDYVQTAVDHGKSKEIIMEKKSLDGFPDFEYGGFWTLPKSLDVVYQEIKGPKWLPVK